MKKTKFTITVDETGQTMTRTLISNTMRVFNTRWTSDKEGKNKITAAKLEQTVYFHMDVEGFKTGSDLHLKLFEYDDFLGIDWANKDDYKFPDTEIVIDAKVKEKNGVRCVSVELTLDNSWEQVIKDDQRGDLSNYIELYWKAFFVLPSGRLIGGIVPQKTEDMLKVSFNERDLYINKSIAGSNLPELIAYDGSPILVMEMGKSMLGVAKTPIKNAIKQGIDTKVHNIALAKLDKGMLVSNKGNIYTKNTQIYTKDIYTNSGEVLEDVKIRKNIGNQYMSTKPISQYDYFSKTGKRVTLLRTVQKVGSVFDFFSTASFMADENATSKPLPIPLGALSPITSITNLITQQNEDIFNEFYEEVTNKEILEAKAEGLETLRKYIYSQRHNYDKGFDWRLIAVSNETANQLLNGKFETFSKLEDADFNPNYSNIEILYRKVENTNRNKFIYIIETIFIDE